MQKTRLTRFGAESVPAGIFFDERKRVFNPLFRVVGAQNKNIVPLPVRCHRNPFLPDGERSFIKRMVQVGLLSGVLFGLSGVATVQAEYSNTALRVGRFELDTPHADTDDIRMVPNTFQGLLLSNNDITSTTLYLTHLDKWAGVDADIPERFRELNGDDGLT
ncbi:MAG: OprD family outer membrane porin, partial [Candidatus Thiodiazotropha sp.]